MNEGQASGRSFKGVQPFSKADFQALAQLRNTSLTVEKPRVAPEEEGLSEIGPVTPGDAFRIVLPNFEGPLDLLLHLIREHRVDILDIPVALIAEKYLEHLDRMREVNLDIAGEFLVMASTLAHIKSRLLLPRQELQATASQVSGESVQEDPRAELVKRLLDYQRYKHAAEALGRQKLLDRDVFPRRVVLDENALPEEDSGLSEISVYKLIEALDRVLKSLEPALQHEVVRERVSLSEAIRKIAEKLKQDGEVSFYALFEETPVRQQVIITFLGVLEMCKLRLIRVFQAQDSDELLLRPRKDALEGLLAQEVEDGDYR